MTSTPESVDERLTTAHDLAVAALHEVTPATTVGDPVDYVLEADGVVSLRFATTLPGYPGWLWTVSVAVVPDSEPTVLEVELLPTEGALLAPEWVPWAVRLADYQAAQAAAAENAEDDDADADDLDDDEDDEVENDLDDHIVDDDDLDDDDDDEGDADDFADGSTAVTHGGDVDGVDIDELDEAPDDESESDDFDDDDSYDDHDEAPNER